MRRIDVVILDSGRYMTPISDWAFIHDSSRHLEVLYSYKYILKDSLEYAIQQFLYDDKNGDAVEAKRRFDEKDFAFSQIKLKIFSDNILLAINTSCNRAADRILECVADIAEHFLVCGYKLRGGICKGNFTLMTHLCGEKD